jgi:hypothetical protein
MTSQHGAYALHAGLATLHALIRTHTPTRPGINMHARTHGSVSNTAFPQQRFANAPQCYVTLRYTHCLSCHSITPSSNHLRKCKTWLEHNIYFILFNLQEEYNFSLLSKTPWQHCDTRILLLNDSFPSVKRPAVKNEWIYTSTLPLLLHGVEREKIKFCWIMKLHKVTKH